MAQHNDGSTAKAVISAAKMMQHLDPGQLAELRRMEPGRYAPAYWQWAKGHRQMIRSPQGQETWMQILRMLAILMPRGKPKDRPELHNRERCLGTVLCDGGDAQGWIDPKPAFSEQRLRRLMAARGVQRATLLEKAVRSLPPGSEVNVVDIASTLLEPQAGRLLALPYYRRLVRAEQTMANATEASARAAMSGEQPDQAQSPETKAVVASAKMLQELEPGALAELRRMGTDQGSPYFWRFAAQFPETAGRRERQDDWVKIVRIIAILTPKGNPEGRPPVHRARRRLGAVLCDGGNLQDWKGPKPAFSEHRLLQLLAARGPQRSLLLERAVRSIVPGSEVNVSDIAYALLKPQEDEKGLTEPYYQRLDRAEAEITKSKKGSK